MQRLILCCLIFINSVLIFTAGCESSADDKKIEKKAPLFNDLGNHEHDITTGSELAQKYFNQGLILSYAFNHAEAKRSFTEAARHDTNCAMAYWGIALVLGPNINAPMDPTAVPEAFYAVNKALLLSGNASQKEKDYINALSKRYFSEPLEDRSSLDQAYADAMRILAMTYPYDMDAQALFVEAVMDVHPWDYWEKNGTSKAWTGEIVETLENILKKDPDHPGANHLYIHAVEASKHPERGLTAADKLLELVPGAGHLVHMPAHIYIRTGNYGKGILANEKAVKADDSYITQCNAQGIYPLAYRPHNHHFLWACAVLGGRSKLAFKAAHHVEMHTDTAAMRQPGFETLQHYYTIPYFSYVRFGKWEEMLEEPEPDLPFIKAIWHYGKGYAYTGKGELDKAEQELRNLEKEMDDPAIKSFTIWGINTGENLTKIASLVLAGEIEAKRKNYDEAVRLLKKAMAVEDELKYNEPPDWFYPVRQNLGAVYIEAGLPEEAEKVYRQDLEKFPMNGWSLFGLEQSLRKQGKNKEADEVNKQFREAWADADIELTASRFL